MMAWHVALSPAAEPVIGMANADGSFSVDNARVFRHATLFNGNVVETTRASSTLDLTGGARILMAAASRGGCFAISRCWREARAKCRAANISLKRWRYASLLLAPDASARVARLAADRIEVAALAGAVRLTNSEGITLASLDAGRVLEFTPQPAVAAAPSTVTGCVLNAGITYMLTDEVTGVTVEVRGSGIHFPLYVAKRVQAAGRLVFPAPEGGPAPQALSLTTVKVLATACAVPRPPRAMEGKPGQSKSHAVIAGVLITVGAVAAAGVLLTREKAAIISPGR
jgi:hypothetical protein